MSCVGGGLKGTASESVNKDKFDLLCTGSRDSPNGALPCVVTTLCCCRLHSNHSQPSCPRQHIPRILTYSRPRRVESRLRPPPLYGGGLSAVAMVACLRPDKAAGNPLLGASHPIKGAKSSASNQESRPPVRGRRWEERARSLSLTFTADSALTILGQVL